MLAIKKTNLFFLTILAITLASFVFLPQPANSQSEDLLGVEYGQHTGLGERDPREAVANIINVGLSLLGIIALVIILYAGFTWMTAGGNEEKVGKARKILLSAVVGLAIILSARAITNFVLRNLYQSTTGFQYIGG